MTDLLIVVNNVAEVVTTTVVGFAHRHGVVCQVDIAVIAEDWSREVSELSRRAFGEYQRTHTLAS